VAALGVAGLGACAVLAACSPVQMGSAAIVGNQRITVSALDTQVSNWSAAAKPLGSTVQLSAAQAPTTVLSWLVRFSIMDQVAANDGINVTQAQANTQLSGLNATAKQDGLANASQLLIASGVPPQLNLKVGRWLAIQQALSLKLNDGKAVTTQTQENTVSAGIGKAQCTAAKALSIQISPQFGRFDYSATSQTGFSIVPKADTLSRTGGVPSPANTEGLTSAAC
jgi:peptidyl-prolyl cis-trans isomerase SurA